MSPENRKSERGASLLEYGAVVALVATVAIAVFSLGLPRTISDWITAGIENIGDGRGSADPVDGPAPSSGEETAEDIGQEGAQEPTVSHAFAGPGGGVLLAANSAETIDGEGLDHDRRDAGREAGAERETDRGRHRAPKEEPDLPGDPAAPDGLGEPVPGEEADAPDPPPWEPVDEGAGEHGSDDWPADDYFNKALAEAGAHAMSGSWPDASRNLLHYLGNTGEPLEQDVDTILEEVPEFRQQTDTHIENIGLQAIERAKEEGADGPVTFPVNTSWQGYGYDPPYANRNWFYAIGGWQYNVNGQVTVYPPEESGGTWRYESNTRVNLRDHYNWDQGKSTDIGPFNVEDETLAEMHRAGVAQEFMMHGRSDTVTREGAE